MMKWIVFTPPYEIARYDSYPEYGSDVVEVEAVCKRDALIRGLRELRRTRSQWVEDRQFDGHNPFNGLGAAIDE
jgi:hypothetical protein